MKIRDEKGEEHPIERGMLVMWHPESKRDGRFGWVGRISIEEYRSIYCEDPFTGAGGNFAPKDLMLLTKDPPNIKEGASSVAARRNNLCRNLNRAMERAPGEEAQQLLYKIYKRITYPPRQDNSWFWNSIAESFDDPRQVSYASKPIYYDNDVRRTRCSFSKFLKGPARKIGDLVLTDEEADLVGKLVGDTFPNSYDYSFEIVRGDDLKGVYFDEETRGFGSCMFGKRSTGWYCENPDAVGALRILQGGELQGRALLWNTDQGVTVLDRIYPSNNGPHIGVTLAHAEKQGWDFKAYQRSSAGDLKSGRMDYTVTMKPSTCGYPYMDTFKYSGNDPATDDEIVLKLAADVFTFASTEGSYQGRRLECYECGRRLPRGEERRNANNRLVCAGCYSNDVRLDYRDPDADEYTEGNYPAVECGTCDRCGDWRLRDHLYTVGTQWTANWCSTCRDNETICCANCGAMERADYVWTAEDNDEDAYCERCGPEFLVQCNACDYYYTPAGMLIESEGSNYEVRCCHNCAWEALDGGEELEYRPYEEAPATPPDPTPPPPPPPAEDLVSYPEGPFNYRSWCMCDPCSRIRLRRDREARDLFPACSLPSCNSPNCQERQAERQRHIEGPYPNANEAAALRRLGRATGLPEVIIEPLFVATT